jgi:hypothetical protein
VSFSAAFESKEFVGGNHPRVPAQSDKIALATLLTPALQTAAYDHHPLPYVSAVSSKRQRIKVTTGVILIKITGLCIHGNIVLKSRVQESINNLTTACLSSWHRS